MIRGRLRFNIIYDDLTLQGGSRSETHWKGGAPRCTHDGMLAELSLAAQGEKNDSEERRGEI